MVGAKLNQGGVFTTVHLMDRLKGKADIRPRELPRCLTRLHTPLELQLSRYLVFRVRSNDSYLPSHGWHYSSIQGNNAASLPQPWPPKPSLRLIASAESLSFPSLSLTNRSLCLRIFATAQFADILTEPSASSTPQSNLQQSTSRHLLPMRLLRMLHDTFVALAAHTCSTTPRVTTSGTLQLV